MASVKRYNETDIAKVLELIKHVHEIKKENVFIWFMGAEDKDGVSWCSDCAVAEPIIETYLNTTKFAKDVHVIIVPLERNDFKNHKTEFQKHPGFKVEKVPTLLQWGGGRIVEKDCMESSHLNLLFENVRHHE